MNDLLHTSLINPNFLHISYTPPTTGTRLQNNFSQSLREILWR
jgi:hypothetical protein